MRLVDVAVAAAQALYLFCPLLVSSVLSGIVLRFALLHELRRPIDGGRVIRGRRIFGDSKTWRGIVVAVVGCVLAVAAQRYVLRPPRWLLVVASERINRIVFGTAMGAGAMVGELPNSFVKRRPRRERGASARGPLALLFCLGDQMDLLATVWP